MKKCLVSCFLLLTVIGSKVSYSAYPARSLPPNGFSVDSNISSGENLTTVLSVKEITANQNAKKSVKSAPPLFEGKQKWIALLLAFFLGAVGAHSFYMGQRVKGYIQMGITGIGSALVSAAVSSIDYKVFGKVPATFTIGALLIGAAAVWGLIDFVRILTGSLEPEEGFDS